MGSGYTITRWKGADAATAEQLWAALEADGYSVFQWTDRPGTTYPEHSHAEDQSHCIVSGRLELSVEGFGAEVLGPGDRDHMPAGTVHSARVVGNDPVVYLIGRKG